MTSSNLLKELLQLTRAEKLELVEELWDSIAADPDAEATPLSPAQCEEFERRIREMDEHPERGRPWDEVRERLRNQLRR